MEFILEVKNLTKRFGPPAGGFTAVDDISFSIKEGEIVGFLGRNGAGKTTTISMLMGLLTPTSGTITVFGKDLQKHREEILTQVNYSSAYINFPRRMSVYENLKIFAYLYDIPNREKRIEEVIGLFNLFPLRNTQYNLLSAGQQTRVHVAKAFLNTPKILFLDEPTAALDPETAHDVRKLIVDMQKSHKISVLFTSHNMAEVEEICDRVIFIDGGKIIAEDTPWALAGRLTTSKINLLIKDGLKRTLEYAHQHNFSAQQDGRYVTVEIADDDIVYFLNFLSEKGIVYQEISIEPPTLEDYFLQQGKKKL